MAKETAIWQVQEFYRGSVARSGKSEGKRDCRRPFDDGYIHICASVRDKLPDGKLSGSLSAAYQNSETVTLGIREKAFLLLDTHFVEDFFYASDFSCKLDRPVNLSLVFNKSTELNFPILCHYTDIGAVDD